MWPRTTRPLEAVLEPRPGDTVIEPAADGDFVFLQGRGRLDLSCGFCGRVLARDLLSIERVAGLCLVCPGCSGYNQTPSGSNPSTPPLDMGHGHLTE